MFFIGVTRFSLHYPNAVGWNLTQLGLSEGEYKKRLFSPERLEPRWWIFSQLTVPQLAIGSAGLQYRHVVQVSPQLPAQYKVQLKQLAKQFPFLVISEEGTAANHREFLDSQIRLMSRKTDSSVFARFRLDDDDVLADDYFKQLTRYVKSEFVGFAVSFGSGFQTLLTGRVLSSFQRLHQPRNSMGLASIGRIGSNGQIILANYSNHARCDIEVPTILDSRRPLVLSIKHRGQDTYETKEAYGATQRAVTASRLEPAVTVGEVSRYFSKLPDALPGYKLLYDEAVEIHLTPDPSAVRLKISGPRYIEVILEYESQELGSDKRFFVSLPFQPEDVDWPWKKFQSNAIVAGIPYMKSGVQTLPCFIPEGVQLSSMTFWQSLASGNSNRLNRVCVREILSGNREK